MYVIKEKLTFIAHPRTGSRACAKLLMGCGAERVSGHHGIDPARIEGKVVACVTRNMFDLMVSWWHNASFLEGTSNQHSGAQPFGDYLKDKVTGDHRWFKGLYHYGLNHSNHVIPYEGLQDGMESLLPKVGLVWPSRMAVIGASKRRPYQEYYTPELRHIVEDHWARDFERTGYKWED